MYKKSLSGKPEAGNCGGRTGSQPNYLSTIIKKETGITFQQHMIQEKLNIARKLLDDTRMTIDEISIAVGYENYISFYNAFRKNVHMTPSEYRMKKGNCQ
ncbi:AraC family transcriptional regulator [Clostridium sp. AM51-4]|nr:AraC family transcriptional regulator [Clostridium sp. AM51-4]RHV51314.1 AraC family transcriptional regulator [Clostridium sp. OM04-12AA]